MNSAGRGDGGRQRESLGRGVPLHGGIGRTNSLHGGIRVRLAIALRRIMTTIVLSFISAGVKGRWGFYEMQRDAANIELLIYGWIIRKGYCSIHGQLAE